MQQIELERVFLVKQLPSDLSQYQPIKMRVGDFYNPNISGASRVDHLNIRQKGDKYEVRKKEGDSNYKKIEHTIYITEEEFELLMTVATQKHEKNLYLYPISDKHTSEIDIYLGKLAGYARVEVEFKDEEEIRKFIPPEWFGPEITEWNHTIHKNLGLITFDDLKKRYAEKGVELKQIFDSKYISISK